MKKVKVFFLLVISINNLVFSLDIDEVYELLKVERGGDIAFLSRINLGYPDGDNWIANRSDGYTYIYTVSSDKEVKRVNGDSYPPLSEVKYLDPSIRAFVDLEYDIMQYISGTQIGDKAAKFGDYNGDGRDEIIFITPSADGVDCTIWGYDSEKGETAYYFNRRFNMISSKGPAPFGFYNYYGTNGIMGHFLEYPQKRYVWEFSAWDEASRKYVERAEIEAEEIDYSMFILPEDFECMNHQNSGKPEETKTYITATTANPPEEIEIYTEYETGKSNQFDIRILLIIAAVVVVGAVVLLAVRRKKK